MISLRTDVKNKILKTVLKKRLRKGWFFPFYLTQSSVTASISLMPPHIKKRPARPYQNGDGEEQNDTDEMEEEENDVPTVKSSSELDVVLGHSGAKKEAIKR